MPNELADALNQTIATLLAEIEAGEGLSLAAAGRLFPAFRGRGAVGPSTVFRWVTIGAEAPDGSIVKLEAVRVGSRWLTARPAVARFVAALTEAANPSLTPAPRTPAQRRKASEAAGCRIKEAGG